MIGAASARASRASCLTTLGVIPNARLNRREKWAASEKPQRNAISVTEPPDGRRRSSMQRASRSLRTSPATDWSMSSNSACSARIDIEYARAIDAGPSASSWRCVRM